MVDEISILPRFIVLVKSSCGVQPLGLFEGAIYRVDRLCLIRESRQTQNIKHKYHASTKNKNS